MTAGITNLRQDLQKITDLTNLVKDSENSSSGSLLEAISKHVCNSDQSLDSFKLFEVKMSREYIKHT
jgi:hypothetical protein